MVKQVWNWQHKNWPYFSYSDTIVKAFEEKFLIQSGVSLGVFKHIPEDEKQNITIDLLSNEAYKTSEIEGEILDRASLQSSIQKHFGYKDKNLSHQPREEGISEMLIDLHHCYADSLTHAMLWKWHRMLMNGRGDLEAIGSYRIDEEPMQIVSGYMHKRHVHFEAPPSKEVQNEMQHFIDWFNRSSPNGLEPLSALLHASIAHLYFENIHPFEDGNGRIGRALVEKILAQHLKRPTLIALSQKIEMQKKEYYRALEYQNQTLQIDKWLTYFAEMILEAQLYTLKEVEFLIQKSKFFDVFKLQINARQEKVLLRIFKEGPKGFGGGLSAKNYISIAMTSPSSATRDLKDLVEKKIFTQTGALKATRYWLNLAQEKS